MNCFVCSAPATSMRSVTALTQPPASPKDAIPICPACNGDWSFALLTVARADIAQDPPPTFHHPEDPPRRQSS